jgi:hypothetical protein
MILLLFRQDEVRYFFNKENKTFGSRKDATEFDNINQVFHEVRNLDGNFHSVAKLETQYIRYRIGIKNTCYQLSSVWLSSKNAIIVCNNLNFNHNEIFYIEEEVYFEGTDAVTDYVLG